MKFAYHILGNIYCLNWYGCQAHRGFTCWISFALVFSFIHCRVLIFALSPFNILIDMFLEMMHLCAGSFMQTKYLSVLIHN